MAPSMLMNETVSAANAVAQNKHRAPARAVFIPGNKLVLLFGRNKPEDVPSRPPAPPIFKFDTKSTIRSDKRFHRFTCLAARVDSLMSVSEQQVKDALKSVRYPG